MNFYRYTEKNNISVNYSVENSKFINNDFEQFDLTLEQNKNLIHFLEKFESNDKFIESIIHKTSFKYDIYKIDVFSDEWYGFSILFYSTDQLAHYSKYDEVEMCWKTSNIALYTIENGDIIFKGWFF